MEDLFLSVATVSAMVSLLLLPLLLALPWLRKRYAASTRRWLWLAVSLVLLVLPFVPRPAAPVQVAPPTAAVSVVVMRTAPAPVTVSQRPDAPARPAPAQSGGTDLRYTQILSTVWLVGVGAVLLWQVAAYALIRRRLLKNAVPLDGYEEYARELGLTGRVRFRKGKNLDTPMTLGVLRPVVLLPEEGAASAAVRHELLHVKRRDVAYKALLSLACALHWFDPLTWLMCRAAGRDVEESCDQAVVDQRDNAYKKAYGELLLTAASDKSIPFTTKFGGGKAQMRARLTALFHPGRRSRVLVCVVLVGALLLGGMVACGQTSKPKDDALYTDETYGFTLRLPENWAGYWQVEEGSEGYAALTCTAEGGEQGWMLLELQVYQEQPEELLGRQRLLGHREGCWVYLYEDQSDIRAESADAGVKQIYTDMYEAVKTISEKDLTFQPRSAGEMLEVMRTASFGVQVPELTYLSDTLVVFRDDWGMGLFNRADNTLRVVDIASQQLNSLGGDVVTHAWVTEDEKSVYLQNMDYRINSGLRPAGPAYRCDVATGELTEVDAVPDIPDRMTAGDEREVRDRLGDAAPDLMSNVLLRADGSQAYLTMPPSGKLRYLKLELVDPAGEKTSTWFYPGMSVQEAAMDELVDSIRYTGGQFRFTVPLDGVPASDWTIHISGRAEPEPGNGMSRHFLDGKTDWTAGETYQFEASQTENFTALTMALSLPGDGGGTVDRDVDLLQWVSPETALTTYHVRSAIVTNETDIIAPYMVAVTSDGRAIVEKLDRPSRLMVGDMVQTFEDRDGTCRVVLPYGDMPRLRGRVSAADISYDESRFQTANQGCLYGKKVYDAIDGNLVDEARSGSFSVEERTNGWAKVSFPTGEDPVWVRAADVSYDFGSTVKDLPEEALDRPAPGDVVMNIVDQSFARGELALRCWVFSGTGPWGLDLSEQEYGAAVRALFSQLEWREGAGVNQQGGYSATIGMTGGSEYGLWLVVGSDTVRTITPSGDHEYHADGAEALCAALTALWPGPEIKYTDTPGVPFGGGQQDCAERYMAEFEQCYRQSGDITDLDLRSVQIREDLSAEDYLIFHTVYVVKPADPEREYWKTRPSDGDGWVVLEEDIELMEDQKGLWSCVMFGAGWGTE